MLQRQGLQALDCTYYKKHDIVNFVSIKCHEMALVNLEIERASIGKVYNLNALCHWQACNNRLLFNDIDFFLNLANLSLLLVLL